MTEPRIRVPKRLRWATNVLPIRASDRVLEIGCGRGVALAAVRRLLAPGGRLYLCYEPPSVARVQRVVDGCRGFLEGAGFVIDDVLQTDLAPHVGVCIVARAPS